MTPASTVRAIDASELERWGRLGSEDVTEAARSLQAAAASGPDRWFLAARGDRPIGRLGLFDEDAGCGAGRREHRLFGVWIADGADAGRAAVGAALIRAAIARLPAGRQTIDLRSNAATHTDIPTRRAMLASAGGRLFQEKAGFRWVDDGADLDDPGPLRFRTIAEVGQDAYAATMGACQAGTLDRNDRYYLRMCGPLAWGHQMLEYLRDADAAAWLLAEDGDGEPVGFVAVGPFDDEGTGTIVHIGVLPAARGRGYVTALLRAATRAARARGFTGLLSDVDTENGPMLAAMERAGHRPDTGWHVWHDRMSVVVLSDGTPVTLRPIDDGNREAVRALRVREDQSRFVATVERSFADAAAQPASHPTLRAVYAGDEPVGFVMLEDGSEPTDEEPDPWPYTLWRLLVDAGFQRRGFGRATLDLVVDHLASRPGADVLWTSAVPGPGSPQPFYERYGFSPTGQIYEGEVVLRLDLPPA